VIAASPVMGDEIIDKLIVERKKIAQRDSFAKTPNKLAPAI